ncbi:MAG: sigma-70 family RNA polymerase sigma factor [Clostridia bacterium]|nr:sigma-70 family RNA polymerase sigma factor [Clostridia bacterium]
MPLSVNEAANIYYGCPNAQTLAEVMTASEGLICSCAFKFGGKCDPEDLHQTGAVGLMKAINSFNPNKGAAFSTWATHCIISEIRHLTHKEMEAAFPSGLGREEEPSGEGGGFESGAFVPSGRFGPDLIRLMPDGGASRLEAEDVIALEEGIGQLPGLYQKVLMLLFFKELSQEEAASLLGLSQRKVSRIKERSLDLLKSALAEKGPEEWGLGAEEHVKSFTIIDNSSSFKLR